VSVRPLLQECDKEPIHIPGLIQPFGALLALRERDGVVEHASENVPLLLGVEVAQALGRPVTELLTPVEGPLDILAHALALKVGRMSWIRVTSGNGHEFDLTLHRHAGMVLLELESKALSDGLSALSFQRELEDAVAAVQASEGLDELCQTLTSELRRLTGFDRVMVYRFDAEWNGAVIAESLAEGVDSYIDQHFPASDIPSQARAMFLQTWVRMIPSSTYVPVPLHAAPIREGEVPLDLGRSLLRSASPIHLEYLRNMQVGASLTISLIRDGQLWGLVTAHHSGPKHVQHVVRRGCELRGRVASSLLRSQEENDDLAYKNKLRAVHAQLLSYMTTEDDFVSALVNNSPNLLDLTSATGAAAAILFEGKWTLIGKVPRIDEINGLVRWLATEYPRSEVFATHELPRLYPPAENFKDVVSGLLAISIPKSDDNYVLWFRPEVIQTISWAGNPTKSVELHESGVRLHPRKSFSLWKEVVKSRAVPWKRVEIEAALELRKSITEIDLERQFHKERIARADVEAEKQRFVFLAEASGVLFSSLESVETLRDFGALATRRFCDWCVIHLWRDGELERALVAHATEEGQLVANEMLHFPLPRLERGTPLGDCMASGAPLLVSRVTRGWVEASSPNDDCTHFLLDRLGLESLVGAPLRARSQTIGLITFARASRTRRFSQDDAAFAMEIGRRVSSAIDNMRLYRDAREATVAREHVLSVVSHDLRTPLNAVQLGLGSMRRRLRDAAVPDSLKQSFTQSLSRIDSSCKRMSELIEDMLSVAKIDAGRFEVQREPVRVESLLREAQDMLEPLASSRAINLRVVNQDPSCAIECEPRRIMQVIANLVGNALKFTPERGEVTIELVRTGKEAVFAVRDTGPGIPPEELPYVFDRFWQASRTARHGAGLGLAIVKGIVEAHGGRVWVESVVGEGSTFWFSLPDRPSRSGEGAEQVGDRAQ
jgi:chemotaxis family two-component system sensor kinase Cph1